MVKDKIPNIPNILPPAIDYNKIQGKLWEAHKAVHELQGILVTLPNKMLLIDPLLTKEAVASSRIEGTQATLEEVYRYEAGNKISEETNKEQDIKEVVNYREALRYAIEKIGKDKHPIGENFIKEIHTILLDSTRGEKQDRENLRRMQVYVGKPGTGIKDAQYIPPPISELPRLLSNWEKYVNLNDKEDPLVMVAVSHYQFEAIHPFMDGNGRIGRILIPIILFQRGYSNYPYLYLSEYFDYKRDDYLWNLGKMDKVCDWEEWVNFFLHSVTIQALATGNKALEILLLYNKKKQKVAEFKSKYALGLLDIIFSRPIISFSIIRQHMNAKSNQTIYNLLEKFQNAGILEEVSQKERNRIYIFSELLKIVRKSKFEEED